MIRLFYGALFLWAGWLLLGGAPVGAASVRMQPLAFQTSLKAGEIKKGFVDVTNTSGQTTTFATSVQAFRQLDNNGSLQFYDNEQVAAGVIPDLAQFTLKPNQTMRLMFIIKGANLPSGDVFAALFVANNQEAVGGIVQNVRVGTLLSIVNGTPPARQAEITALSAGFWQFGSHVEGSYVVRNQATAGQATGFYPDVTVALNPFYSEQTVHSSLVFAGHQRQVPFTVSTSRFGIYQLSARFGGSQQTQLVFIMTGYWRWLAPLVATIVVAGGVLFYRRRSRRAKRLR